MEWTNADLQPAHPGIHRVDFAGPLPYSSGIFSSVYHSNVLEHLRQEQASFFMQECARICRRGGILRVAVPDLEAICRLYLKKLDEAVLGGPSAREEYHWILLELLDQMTRESSGGQMGKFLEKIPKPVEDFVYSRIGNEAREFVRQHRLFNQNPPSRHGWWKKWQEKAKRLWASDRQRALAIGYFRLGGEVHQWMYDRFSLSDLMGRAGFCEIKIMPPGQSQIPGWEGFFLEVGADGSIHKPDSIILEGVKT